jgi:hypothetical protein
MFVIRERLYAHPVTLLHTILAINFTLSVQTHRRLYIDCCGSVDRRKERETDRQTDGQTDPNIHTGN